MVLVAKLIHIVEKMFGPFFHRMTPFTEIRPITCHIVLIPVNKNISLFLDFQVAIDDEKEEEDDDDDEGFMPRKLFFFSFSEFKVILYVYV